MKPGLGDLTNSKAPHPLCGIAIPASLGVLVLGPHPDDFDAAGVTLRRLKENGNPIRVVVVRTGGGVEDAHAPGTSRAHRRRLREEEQRMSLRFFGLPEERATFIDLVNDGEDQLVDSGANRERLESSVVGGRPDVVVLPHGNDTNNGHRAMYSMFKQIATSAGRPLAALLMRDPKTIAMRTDVYTPFGMEDADWKGELLRFHDSQHQRNLRTRGHGFDARILDVNRRIARDLSIDAEYAEAFEVETFNMPVNRALA